MTSIFDNGHIFTNAEWLDRSQISLTRPWYPQQCVLTKKWLWIKPAMLIRRVITGPGTPVIIDSWIEPKAYTMQTLKGWD